MNDCHVEMGVMMISTSSGTRFKGGREEERFVQLIILIYPAGLILVYFFHHSFHVL